METTCPRPEVLGAYAEGRLPGAETTRLEAHLARCASCGGQVSVLRGLLRIPEPRETDLPEISAATWSRLGKLAPVSRSARSTRRRPAARAAGLWKAALAAAAILVTVALFVVLSPPPAPETARVEEPKPAPAVRPEEPIPPAPATPSQAHRRVEAEKPPVAPPPKPSPPPVPQKPDPEPKPELPKPEPPQEPPKPPEERRATVAAGPGPTLIRIQGEVRIATAGSRFPARPGQALVEGQSVETAGPASSALLRFADGTLLEVWGDTAVADLSEGRDDRGKRIRLLHGLVQADVVKQPEGRPLVLVTPVGEARVLGTKLKLGTDATRTVLEVREGAVQLVRVQDARSVEVKAGQYAAAADLVPKPLPEPRRMPKLPYPGVDQAKVDAAIDQGVAWLLKSVPLPPIDSEFGAFTYDEIVLYTLLHAGLDRRHPAFQSLLKGMLERKLERTYDVALQAMVLSELDPVKYQPRLAQCCQFLVDNQCDNGQWDYGKVSLFAEEHPTVSRKTTATPAAPRDFEPAPPPRARPRSRIAIRRGRTGLPAGDSSNSQYGALGLRACIEAEVHPPAETLQTALRSWEKSQDPDGGWAYHGYSGQAAERVAYGSMTAGGLASVLIYRHYLKLTAKPSPHAARAQKWIADNFSVRENPRMSTLPAGFMGPVFHYWLYALERSGVLGNVDQFGAHDWYEEGAMRLLETQAKDGNWVDTSGGRSISDTCFAILFLRRATAPLVASVDWKK